jgi:hypothetical protein
MMGAKLIGCLICFAFLPQCLSQPSPFIVRVGSPSSNIDQHAAKSFNRADGASGRVLGETGEPAACRSIPISPPVEASEWRSSCWCGTEELCPDEAVAAFVRQHRLERELSQRFPERLGDRRFLVCKPMGGIGNWITGLLSCAAMAIATNRSMMLASPPPTPAHLTTSYDAPVETLFDFPIDQSLEVLGPQFTHIPFLWDETGRARDEGPLQMVDLRLHDLLCRNLTSTYHRPVAVMPAHLWLGAITRNRHHAPFFQRHFGSSIYGPAPVVEFLGPWLIRPRASILDIVHKLEAALLPATAPPRPLPSQPPGVVIGLQIRLGMQIDASAYADRPPAGSGAEFARCAYSFLPTSLRARPAAWVVAADSTDAKRDVLMLIAQSEGPIVAASSEALLRAPDAARPPAPLGGKGGHGGEGGGGLGIAGEYFAAEGRLAPAAGMLAKVEVDERAGALGFVVVVFASGARAVVLARQPQMHTKEVLFVCS